MLNVFYNNKYGSVKKIKLKNVVNPGPFPGVWEEKRAMLISDKDILCFHH